MKPLDKAGFTIIETILFIGITGLLISGILIGTGSSINIQRYRDSVTSLQSFFQQQYSDVANVSNGLPSSSCDGTNKLRGQSDCVILGKYITTTEDSGVLSVKDVVGTIPNSASMVNDIESLKQYNIKITTPLTTTSYNTEWGALIVKPEDSKVAATLSILIVRSPLSGVIRTFIDETQVLADTKIQNLLNITALNQSAKVCLNPASFLNITKMAVQIDSGASSSSDVETLGDASADC